MTLATNAFTTYLAIGNREDLSDIIYNIAPTDTPFLSGVPRTNADAVLHEWQTDTLAAAAQNSQLEGDVPSADSATATVRLSNTAQIAYKTPRVTGTQEVMLKAGRRSELAYQVAKRGHEIKRDMENDLLANTQENTGGASTARVLGAIPSWIDTNTSNGTSGTDGSLGNTLRTDGTQRDFTEVLFKDVIQLIWDAGGDPDCIMLGSFNKRVMSGFTGNATRFKTAEDKKLVATIDVYDSDWGSLQIVPNRFQRARDVLIIQKEMWAVAYLRPFHIKELGTTGDEERRMLIAEYTLEARNEAASGAVWDVNVS